MVALRALKRDTAPLSGNQHGMPPLDSPDWLTLQQAACELGVSASTVRRMVRDGRLLNRMVPHRGGFAYLVFVGGSRHARLRDHEHGRPAKRRLWAVKRSSETPITPVAGGETTLEDQRTIAQLERQVDQLSYALSRALRTRQRALPAGMGEVDVNPANPYARYRWIARRPRWWPF
jgi:hypothetical protein